LFGQVFVNTKKRRGGGKDEGRGARKDERRTSNIERPTSNEKQTGNTEGLTGGSRRTPVKFATLGFFEAFNWASGGRKGGKDEGRGKEGGKKNERRTSNIERSTSDNSFFSISLSAKQINK